MPHTSSTPSQSLAAASPFGMGVTTGPKKAASLTRMIGVPTSMPTRSMPTLWLARSASSKSIESQADINSVGNSASPSAASTVAGASGSLAR